MTTFTEISAYKMISKWAFTMVNDLNGHSPWARDTHARTEASSKCTEPIMSAWFSRSAALVAALPRPSLLSHGERSLLTHVWKKEAQFALRLATPSSNYRKFNTKSLGISCASCSVSRCRKAAVHCAYVGKGKQVTLQKHCSSAYMWKQNPQLLRDGLFS